MDYLDRDPANREDQSTPPLDLHLGLRWQVYFSPPGLHPIVEPYINLWVLEPAGWVCYPFPHEKPYIQRAEILANLAKELPRNKEKK